MLGFQLVAAFFWPISWSWTMVVKWLLEWDIFGDIPQFNGQRDDKPGFLFEIPYLQPTFRGTPGSAVVQCHLGPIWFNFGGSSHVVTGFHIYKPSISLGLSSKDSIWKTKLKHTKTIISYYFWCSIRDFTSSANTAWLVWKTREHWVEWYVQPSSSANRRPTAEISPTDMSSRKNQQYKFY